jgi:WD40 repeat protein
MPTAIFVAVTGSTTDSRFAVTNFSDAAAPTTVLVQSPFPTGCVVDCSNNLGNQSVGTLANSTSALAAVGDYTSGTVAIYNLLNPAAPTLQNTFDSGLGGIGAVAFDAQSGNNLALGASNGSTVVLMNVQTGAVTATAQPEGDLVGGVYSLALSGSTAFASGVQLGLVMIDFSNLSSPQVGPIFIAGLNAQGKANYLTGQIACDFDGSTLAVGDGSGNVYTYDRNGNYTGAYGGGSANGITSVAVETGDSAQIAAGCIASGSIVLITAPPPNPPVDGQTVQIWSGQGPNPGGALAFFGLPFLFASSVTGGTVSVLNELVWPSDSVLGVATGVSLAQSLQPTLGATAFNPLSGCLAMLFGRRQPRRR